ncbi:dUTP diphosphatase [bacterium]|nr:dUTP diphosphatase [bacterium]
MIKDIILDLLKDIALEAGFDLANIIKDKINRVDKGIKINLLSDDAILPKYAHTGDSGMDLCATESLVLHPGERALLSTGISLELPVGLEAQVRSRSGLALNQGISVLNSPGTIDSGYRGELKVILINHGSEPSEITKGMRIAQLVFATVTRVDLEVEHDDNERGEAGVWLHWVIISQ